MNIDKRMIELAGINEGKSITIQNNYDGEYRVPGPKGNEAQAYYTDDKQDAIDTAKKVWGNDVNIKFKKVEDWKERLI